jgi:GNAT superfamily N-acetyltransferase
MGLGKALVNECIGFARLAGYRKIVLWTQSILLAAHRIDENAGLPSRKRKSRTPAAERI